MILAQADLDAILDRKVRKRLLELPVRYGRFGERKRCPMRVGGVYHLKPPIPYERYASRASEQPTRARAVLWLIGRCERHQDKPTTITVREVERQGETWLVSFLKGQEAEVFNDDPLYLSSDGGFTAVAARQAVPADPEYLPPLAEDLARARLDAREKRAVPELASVRRLTGELQTCRAVMTNVKAGTLLKRAQRNLEAAQRALLSEGVLDSEMVAASAGSAVEADRPPSAAPLARPESPSKLGE
jgi:hypothetical protein